MVKLDQTNPENPKQPIDATGHRNRLKQRLLRGASEGLDDGELLELLLAYAIPRRNVKPLAEELLQRFGSLRGVLDASALELTNVSGVGTHTAAMVRLVREIVLRCSEGALPPSDMIEHPRQMGQYLLHRMAGAKEERLLLVFLDEQGLVLGEEWLGAGTIDQVVMFPRQVMERALRCKASSLVIAHNHPHGPPLPSRRDREEAERLRDILRPFDITLRDCIVVGQNRCFSIFKNAPL